MNKLLVTSLLATMFLIAGEVKGTWKGQVNRPDGTRETEAVLFLNQEGDTVTGRIGTSTDDMVPVRNVKLDGNKLTFEVAANESTFVVTLDVDGDTAKGGVVRTRDGQSGPPLPIELKRSKE